MRRAEIGLVRFLPDIPSEIYLKIKMFVSHLGDANGEVPALSMGSLEA